MNEWWNNLALREKQMVSLGALAVIIFIGYFFLWSPLDAKVSSLRKQISHDQELLIWMQDANKQIQIIEKTTKTPTKTSASGSLLTLVQKSINQSALKNLVNQMHQSENNSVQLTFYKVDFDKLIVWLIQFTQQQNVVIKQITITASSTPGVVAADVVLSS